MGNSVRADVGVRDNASGPIDTIRDRFAKLQADGAKGLVIGAGAALATAGFTLLGNAVGRATYFVGDSIKAASDLNETMSKSSVIFGPAADKMEKFGEAAAQNLGLSKQAAIEAAASFGNFFTGVGQSQDAAEGMSEKIVTLAGDLASFNNLDPTDVLQKLRSGLTGEAEPLRSLGVFLTEAKVKAKGMELGLADAHGELSEGSKVLARYALIMDETKTAQGDFARTSDGLANSQRRMDAEMKNVSADFGKYLLPIQLEATKDLVGLLKTVDAVPAAFDAMGGSTTEQAQVLAEFGDMIPLVGGQIQALAKQIVTSADDDKSAMGDLSNFAGKMADDVVGSYKNVGTASIDMRDKVKESMDASAKAAEDNEQRTTAALKGIIDNAYDPLIIASHIAATQRELDDIATVISAGGTADTLAQIAEARKKGDDDLLAKLVANAAAEVQSARDRQLELKKTLAEQLVDQAEYGSVAQRAAYLNGQLQNQALIDGLASKDPQVRAQAQATVAQIENELRSLNSLANGYGWATGSAWSRGITDSILDGYADAYYAVKQYDGLFYASSPPGPKSPLHKIDEWGERTGEAWSEGLGVGIRGGDAQNALAAVAARISARNPDNPALTGGLATAMASSGAAYADTGGTTGELVINLDGREIARVVDRHMYYGARTKTRYLPD